MYNKPENSLGRKGARDGNQANSIGVLVGLVQQGWSDVGGGISRAVEVLSPGPETRDRGVKFKAYQHYPTVHEFVRINQFAQYVEIWQRGEQNVEAWQYRHDGPGEFVEFASVNMRVAIDELYRGLDFSMQDEDEDEE